MTADNNSNSNAGDANASPALRYVVLRHDGIPDPHYDLMFEMQPGSTLTTWRSPEWPIQQRVDLTPLSPHRRDYLNTEGPLSGNRGYVRRIASGTFVLSKPNERTWTFRLRGSTIEDLVVQIRRNADGRELWEAIGS